jgi:RNA polymerase sigma factor (TIGR02999 family)
MSRENPGQTLTATALVHEAYVRLVDVEREQHFDTRGHFFAAAAEAMRRILVDKARRKCSRKGGGDLFRHDVDEVDVPLPEPPEDVLALDEALTRLQDADRMAAELVRLRFFAGLRGARARENHSQRLPSSS